MSVTRSHVVIDHRTSQRCWLIDTDTSMVIGMAWHTWSEYISDPDFLQRSSASGGGSAKPPEPEELLLVGALGEIEAWVREILLRMQGILQIRIELENIREIQIRIEVSETRLIHSLRIIATCVQTRTRSDAVSSEHIWRRQNAIPIS